MKKINRNYRKNIKKESMEINRPLPIKKLKLIGIFATVIFVFLILRLFWWQFINGSWLKEKAYRQQTSSTLISPDRGSILDSNGKSLAISEAVDTISINPTKIDEDKKALVAQGLSEIFDLEYEEIYNKVNSESSVETIIKKVEKDKVQELEDWMSKNKITVGINIDEDNKRYYPYSEAASQVIGFCGTDNQGLAGIEASYDNILSGRSGKIIATTDINNSEISDNYTTYVEAENGSDVYLTIDINIQTIVEKYLKTPVDEDKCEYATAIVMEPSSGNILSMATYPNFDLNSPFTPNTEEAKEAWDISMTTSEKSTFLNQMWRNRNVSDVYEPGSTFKTLISAIALEENITEVDVKNDFYCMGYEEVADKKIRCWSTTPHGYQTLKQALSNSCNPAFIQLGNRIGVDTYYKYFEAFGLFNTTGITLPGESNSIFHSKENVGKTELATMSFGQRFNITPIQLITAVSSIANGGVLVKPQIVSKIVNNDTGATTTTQTETVRQVISKETADNVIDMMEYVATDGTGKPGNVKGYTIAAKTGTSEAITGTEKGNTLSYIAIAPSENPKLVILVVLYNMTTSNTHGGTIVGPIVSNILSEALPYLGISSDDANTDSSNNYVTIPDITNKTIAEAEKILKNTGLNVVIASNEDKNSTLVSTQVPSARQILLKDSTVIIYGTNNSTRTSVTVPDLKNMTLTQAKATLKQKNLNISYTGTGLVASQDIASGTSVEEGSIINVNLSY